MIFEHMSVNRSSSVPLEAQIARQLTQLIAAEAIPGGARLPPIRELAKSLGVNLHTVRAAYRRLADRALVDMAPGRGTTVIGPDLAGLAADRLGDRSFTVGVILPFPDPFYGPVLQGLESATHDTPTRVVVTYTDERIDSALSCLRYFIATGVDGVISVSHYFPDAIDLEGTGLPPLVFADWPGAPPPSIVLDPSAMGDLVRHVIEHGHTRVDLLAPPVHHPNVAPIIATWLAAVEAAGAEPRVHEAAGWTQQHGYNVAAVLLEGPDRPSVIMCATDQLAIGAVQAARERGRTVGEDVAVTGYGDTPQAALIDPALTAVTLPAADLGRRAMIAFLELQAGGPVDPITRLESSVAIRDSCGSHG